MSDGAIALKPDEGAAPESKMGDAPAGGDAAASSSTSAPRKRSSAPATAAASPDAIVPLAEEIADKLKLLDFEEKVCRGKDFAPFPRTYFALPAANAGVQFQHFVEALKFLMRQCQREFTTDKWDDPNTISNKIMLELKEMGFDMNFAAIKLKQAHGEHVCKVLLYLADQALELSGFAFKKPVYTDEMLAEEAEVDEDAEVVNDAVADAGSDDDEEVMYSEMVAKPEEDADASMTAMLESDIDPIAWKTELVRVAPRLKIKPAVSSRQWRAHFDQAQTHHKVLSDLFPGAQSALRKIQSDLASTLERVSSKEKYLNNTFSHMGGDYAKAKSMQEEHTSSFQTTSQEVADLTNQLATITDSLDEVKSQMDDRSSNMTDTSPLVRIKAALSAIKAEIKAMELRIGVVGHTLMQSKLRGMKPTKKGSDTAHDDSADFDISDDDAGEVDF